MSKKIMIFETLDLVNIEKKNQRGTMRALHTDLIDNKWVVTFVSGTDDPHNSDESKKTQTIQKTNLSRKKVLEAKIKKEDLTLIELNELYRINNNMTH